RCERLQPGLTITVVALLVVIGGAIWLQRGEEPRAFMIASASSYASEAGAEILRKGGSAVDAAIAVSAVLSLVEPESSGLAGGAFLLHYNEAEDRIDAYDGRETAPAGATPALFLDEEGKTLTFPAAMIASHSV